MRADGIVLALTLAIGAASVPVAAVAGPPDPEGVPSAVAADEAGSAAQSAAWMAYLQTVLDAMRASTDVHEQALALAAAEPLYVARRHAGADLANPGPAATAEIAALADTHPDDPLLQRVAARYAPDAARTVAIDRLQRLEPANAAAWALSLPDRPDPAADLEPTLAHMATSREYDDGMAAVLAIWRRAFARMPPPADLVALIEEDRAHANFATMTDAAAVTMSIGIDGGWSALFSGCRTALQAGGQRADSCLAIAHVLLHEGRTLIAAGMGAGLLRTSDLLVGEDAERDRQLAWWKQTVAPGVERDPGAFVDDWIATGSEVEALRLAAIRAGKESPPKDWQPPSRG
jgi:hypothetical protein